MNKLTLNKIAVTLGSLLTVNGLLLLADPPRFARLRRSSWMPDTVNHTLDRFSRDRRQGRTVGMAAAALGSVLLVTGLISTRPRLARGG